MPTLAPLTWILIVSSLLVLILGSWAYLLSSARTLIMNTLFGSFCLLFAAYQEQVVIHARTPDQIGSHAPWTYILPFLVTMLFLGRAIGLSVRARREKELIPSCRVIFAATLVCAVATTYAFLMKAA